LPFHSSCDVDVKNVLAAWWIRQFPSSMVDLTILKSTLHVLHYDQLSNLFFLIAQVATMATATQGYGNSVVSHCRDGRQRQETTAEQ